MNLNSALACSTIFHTIIIYEINVRLLELLFIQICYWMHERLWKRMFVSSHVLEVTPSSSAPWLLPLNLISTPSTTFLIFFLTFFSFSVICKWNKMALGKNVHHSNP